MREYVITGFYNKIFYISSYHPNCRLIIELIFLCMTDLGFCIINTQVTQHLRINEDTLLNLIQSINL